VLAFDNAFLDEGGGIWKRMLAHLVLTDAERDPFYQLPDRGPRREEWLLGRIAAKDALREWAFHQHQLTLASADIELSADARPVAHAPGHPALKLPPVSISHSRGGAVAMVGEPGAACGLDYQRLDHVDPALLAAGGLNPREHALLTRFTGEALTRATVALWCAKEAAAKSAGLGFAGRPQDWVVSHLGDGDAPATATVTHDAVRHDIELRYPGPAEVVALCRHLQPAPLAAHP
jgi:phosphopantetheinyl transferase